MNQWGSLYHPLELWPVLCLPHATFGLYQTFLWVYWFVWEMKEKKNVDIHRENPKLFIFLLFNFSPLFFNSAKDRTQHMNNSMGVPTRTEEIQTVGLSRELKHACIYLSYSGRFNCKTYTFRSVVHWNPNTCFVLQATWALSASSQSTNCHTGWINDF